MADSNRVKALAIDTNTIKFLLEARGAEGLSTLLAGDVEKLVFTNTIRAEIDNGPAGIADAFNDWRTNNPDNHPLAFKISRTQPGGKYLAIFAFQSLVQSCLRKL